MTKWCYSSNGEDFWAKCDTKEEAISEAIEDYGDECSVIYIGNPETPAIYVSADRITDEAIDRVYDECGDYAADFLSDVANEHYDILEARINEVFQGWMTEFGYTPTCYTVKNIEEIKIK